MTLDIHIYEPEELEELAPWLVQAMKNTRKRWEAKNIPQPALELQPDLPLQVEPEAPKPVEKPEEAPPLQEVPKADLEVVRATLNGLKQDKGAMAVRELLEKFGVKRVPDIPADKYDELMDAVKAIYDQEG